MNNSLLEIDKYLDGEMSDIEKQTFETKIDSDPLLARELKFQQEMRVIYNNQKWLEGDKKVLEKKKSQQMLSFFKSEEANILKNTIEEVVSQNRSNSGNRNSLFLSIAATVAILIAISVFLFKNPSYQDLYTDYINIDNIPSLVSRGDTNTLLEEAQLEFENKKYKEAIRKFKEYQQNETSINPLTYIYLGVSYLELHQYDNALLQFEELSKSNTLQSKKADWYKVMVFLKQKDKNKLLETLQYIIADKNNYNFNEAQQLLKEID